MSPPPSGPELPAAFGGPVSWLYDLSHHLASKASERRGQLGRRVTRQPSSGVSPSQTQVQLLALGTGEEVTPEFKLSGLKGPPKSRAPEEE